MAVYKRSYRGYAGVYTPAWSRFLILPRYAYRTLFRSRFLTGFMMLCLFVPVVYAALIYIANNLDFLARFQIGGNRPLLEINAKFFYYFLDIQGVMAVILTTFVGPSLVSPDLVNNGLALYFCRPFSRAEYVLGKMWALGFLLSSITWIPGLILFGLQSSLAGKQWFTSNWNIAWSLFAGGMFWILVLSLLALALSAWVRWRIAAGALLLGVFFLGAGFGHAINSVMRTNNGYLIDLGNLIAVVWGQLFGVDTRVPIPPEQAWAALLAVCGLCLYLLARKVRAYEVVR